jgi:hypothetical protein
VLHAAFLKQCPILIFWRFFMKRTHTSGRVAAFTAPALIAGLSALLLIGCNWWSDSDDSPNPTPTPVTTVSEVTVSPAKAAVAKSGSLVFSATVKVTEGNELSVTWWLGGAHVAGTKITLTGGGGELVVDPNETATTLTVKATSTADPSKFGTATVTIVTTQAIADATEFTETEKYATVLTITPENVTLDDKEAIEAALAAYETLSDDAKAVLADEKAILDALLAKINALGACRTSLLVKMPQKR